MATLPVVARRNARKSSGKKMKYDVVAYAKTAAGYAKTLGADLQTTAGLIYKYRYGIGPAAIITYLLPHEVLDPNPNWYSTIGRNITMLTAVGLFFGASIGIPRLYKDYILSDEKKNDTINPTDYSGGALNTLDTSPAQVNTVIPNPLIPPRTNNNPRQYIPKNDLFPVNVPF